MGKSIFKNLSYNVLLQIVLMVLPLISIPYVSRVLGAEGIGAYSFTLSLTQYFIIVGTLGTSLYGNRQIAYARDSKEELSKTFWSIFIVRLSSTSVALLVYYALFWNTTDLRTLRMIQSFHILAQVFDITWLFIGLEDFKRIVTRNLVIKILGLVLIFSLVKTKEDVLLYTLINLGMSISSSLIMWLYTPQLLAKVVLKKNDVQNHIVPIFKLFIPQIASQVYVLLDKTMLGYLSSLEQVGFYTQAERMVRSVLELTSALGVVMLPRMSHIFSKGNYDQMRNYLNKSLVGVSYIALPMMVGLMGLTHEFIPWFFGDQFLQVEPIMKSISLILLFISLSSVLGVQYLLPANRVNEFTFSIVMGAVVNFSLNFLLIPHYAAMGAVIGTISAECTVMGLQFYFLRNEVNMRTYTVALLKYGIAVTFMYISVRFLGTNLGASMLTNLIQMGVGMIVYFGVLFVLKEEMNALVFTTIRHFISRFIPNMKPRV